MEALLIIDSDPSCIGLVKALTANRLYTQEATDMRTGMNLLAFRSFDFILIDFFLFTGNENGVMLSDFLLAARNATIILAAAMDSLEPAIKAAMMGIHGFVTKPLVPEMFLSALRKAKVNRRHGLNPPLNFHLPPSEKYGFQKIYAIDEPAGILGKSQSIKAVREKIRKFAKASAPVLILGESGTGKELAANALHMLSPRKQSQFLAIDCASIPETLAESELFGTVKGAFTGAVERKGVFELADGGSLFLDEVGELPLNIQAKLLRTLESGHCSRLGTRANRPFDTRLISATNARLYANPERFRPELLNRLNTLSIVMPALRNCSEDIPVLANAFLSVENPDKILGLDAMDKLQNWRWPGNVRELKNTIIRAAILAGEKTIIDASCIETGAESIYSGDQGILF